MWNIPHCKQPKHKSGKNGSVLQWVVQVNGWGDLWVMLSGSVGYAAAFRAVVKHFGLFFCCFLLSKHHCVNDGIALHAKKVTSTYTGTKRASFLLELAMIWTITESQFMLEYISVNNSISQHHGAQCCSGKNSNSKKHPLKGRMTCKDNANCCYLELPL